MHQYPLFKVVIKQGYELRVIVRGPLGGEISMLSTFGESNVSYQLALTKPGVFIGVAYRRDRFRPARTGGYKVFREFSVSQDIHITL